MQVAPFRLRFPRGYANGVLSKNFSRVFVEVVICFTGRLLQCHIGGPRESSDGPNLERLQLGEFCAGLTQRSVDHLEKLCCRLDLAFINPVLS